MEPPKPYQIEIIPRTDILNYTVSGYVNTEDDFHQFIRDVNVIILQSGHIKVLADCRNLEGFRPGALGAIKVVERDFLPEVRGRRIAVIEREENIGNMIHREIVASNRGYILKYFTNSEEAEAWLK